MQILSIKYVKDGLIERVRQTKLLNQETQPYRFSEILLVKSKPMELLPCQTYVLEKQLDIISQIANYAKYNLRVDICELDGYLEINTSEGTTTFTPPIIERDIASVWNVERTQDILICDGMHRVYWAIENQRTSVNCVYIDSPALPYYAYPNTGGWDSVDVLTKPEIPEYYKKKDYRIDDHKKLYRDFNTAFEHHVGKPRGRGAQ